MAHMEEGTVESGETIERVSSVTYDAQGNAVAASPEVLSSVSYDAQGNVMSAEQVAAAAAAAAPVERTYTVVKGDTLSAIGKKFGVNWRDIAALNHIKNPDLIHPGEVFRIPN